MSSHAIHAPGTQRLAAPSSELRPSVMVTGAWGQRGHRGHRPVCRCGSATALNKPPSCYGKLRHSCARGRARAALSASRSARHGDAPCVPRRTPRRRARRTRDARPRRRALRPLTRIDRTRRALPSGGSEIGCKTTREEARTVLSTLKTQSCFRSLRSLRPRRWGLKVTRNGGFV